MWTLQDAKNRFSAVVDAALAGAPQYVTRRGRPAVVVVAIDEFDRLLSEARRERVPFAAHLMSLPSEGMTASNRKSQAKPRDICS